jgi:hypothetical protein
MRPRAAFIWEGRYDPCQSTIPPWDVAQRQALFCLSLSQNCLAASHTLRATGGFGEILCMRRGVLVGEKLRHTILDADMQPVETAWDESCLSID